MKQKIIPKKIILVGCGIWGKNHARNLHEMGVLAGIADPKAGSIAAQYNVPHFDNITQMIDALVNDADADAPTAIVIASPDITHYQYGKIALEAGLDVLMEKPLAMDLQQARELCIMAKDSDKILMVGHLLRYHAAFRCLLAQVQAGFIGDVQNILSIRHDMMDTPRDSDLIWGYGPHDASMVASLVSDSPLTVSGFYGDILKECVLSASFASGAHKNNVGATISLSWQAPKRRLLMVQGTKGQIVFDDAKPDGMKIILHLSGEQPKIIAYDNSEPLRTELQHFADSIQNRTQALTGADEALKVMEILDACYNLATK
ncbi:MAG: Gfo/Idh/MocA family oxidoreductase [Alphaproteobacteria bacterium]|nr:Gfo/Idh/MocA family oxidoreductase [Alphaproteobacteria bacterium]